MAPAWQRSSPKVGHVPWIALGIIATWEGDSLLKKRTPLAALPGFALVTLLLAPGRPRFSPLARLQRMRRARPCDATTTALVLSSGLATTLPLLIFAEAARHLRLTTLGLLQYLAPTCQFLLGWLVYRESFTTKRALAFALIGAGLALYGLDLLRRTRPTA